MDNEEKVNTPLGTLTRGELNDELKMLKSSWQMYEKSKEDALRIRKNAVDKSGNQKYSEKSTQKTMELLETMQDDIVKKYLALGGDMEELKKPIPKKGRPKKGSNMDIFKRILEKEKEDIKNGVMVDNESDDASYVSPDMEDMYVDTDIKTTNDDSLDEEKEPFEDSAKEPDGEEISIASFSSSKMMGNRIKYDVIPLPSKGMCYKKKIAKVPVSYLTAYDENMIISPNMYNDGTFIDNMLKSKIMTDDIDPYDMLPGDRDAIILWLRASGYGNEFPVSAVDNETGERFETTVDLSQLKYRKFNLKADSDGYFDYVFPVTKDKIKFKFLTYKDLKELDKENENEDERIRKTKAQKIASEIETLVSEDNSIERSVKNKFNDAVSTLKEYADNIEDDNTIVSHAITNRLAKSIVSVNGVTDRKYIEEYVMYLNVRDSMSLRRYIVDNEPGVDFNVTIKKPESLGGGSVNMFLSIDQYIFLTLA